MKKLLLLVLSLFISGVSYAQPKKGDWQVSAGYTYDFTRSRLLDHKDYIKEKTYSYRISPGVEYFISNRFSVGLSPYWQETNYEFNGYFESADHAYRYGDTENRYLRDIGLEARVKYYQPIAKNLFFTVNGFLSYAFSKIKTNELFIVLESERPRSMSYFFADAKINTFSIGIVPGFSYYIRSFGIHLNFLPVSYLNDHAKDMTGMYAERVEPYYLPDPSGVTGPYFAKEAENPSFARRKNDFDVNWGSFSLAVSYKF